MSTWPKMLSITVFPILPWLNPSSLFCSPFDIFSLVAASSLFGFLPSIYIVSFCVFKIAITFSGWDSLLPAPQPHPQKAAPGHSMQSSLALGLLLSSSPNVWTPVITPSPAHWQPVLILHLLPIFSSQKTLNLANVRWYQIHGLPPPFPTEFSISDVPWWIFFLDPKKSQECLKKKISIFWSPRFR